MTTATNSGAAENTENLGGEYNAAEALLARFLPKGEEDDASKKKPSENADENDTSENEEGSENQEASDESPEVDGDEEPSEKSEDDAEPKKSYVESDEVFVKIKVGDEELEVPVKDLKRLHGQEAALTRKSQEVADQRKKVETQAQEYAAGLDSLMKRASAKADEFRKINFLALTKDPNVSAEQMSVLQDEARKAFEEENFLKGELNNFVTAAQKQAQTQMSERARECVKVLSDKDSPLHIDGWNQKSYDELLSFAKAEGMDPAVANNIVDAPVFKLLHMAMMFKKGASKVVVTKKVNKTPKKIVKTSNSPTQQSNGKASKEKQAMKTLKQDGSVDNATDALMARWESNQPEE